jgi:flagellar motor protein MotB
MTLIFYVRFQDCEVERIRKEEEAKYKKKLEELTERESRIQADICRREEEITRKLNESEDRLATQRQSLDNDLEIKQKELSELTTQLQEQRLEVAHKLRQAEVGLCVSIKTQEMFDDSTLIQTI